MGKLKKKARIGPQELLIDLIREIRARPGTSKNTNRISIPELVEKTVQKYDKLQIPIWTKYTYEWNQWTKLDQAPQEQWAHKNSESTRWT